MVIAALLTKFICLVDFICSGSNYVRVVIALCTNAIKSGPVKDSKMATTRPGDVHGAMSP